MSKATRIAALNAALQLRTAADTAEDLLLRATQLNEWLDPEDVPGAARPTVAETVVDKIKTAVGGKGDRSKR